MRRVFVWFGGLQLGKRAGPEPQIERRGFRDACLVARTAHAFTVAALVLVAVLALVYGWSIGFVALLAAAALHVFFPQSSRGAERRIPWDVVLLVCGIVTYVSALQRAGTVDAIGAGIIALDSPLLSALLICAVAAVTSAFASSAGILGVMIVLAAPFMAQGAVERDRPGDRAGNFGHGRRLIAVLDGRCAGRRERGEPNVLSCIADCWRGRR